MYKSATRLFFQRWSITTHLVVFVLFLLSLSGSVFADGESLLRVTFLDVGQGDSIMLQTADKTVLIDAGDDQANAANAAIIPFCKKEGIKKIDTCVITHPHRDHFGGYLDLIQAVSIGEFVYSTDSLGTADPEEGGGDSLLYQRLYDLIKEKNIPYRQAKIGATFDWGKGVQVELLHAAEGVFAAENIQPVLLPPPPPARGDASGTSKISANEQSLIFKVTAGKISYLFTGDSEKGAETWAIENFRDRLPCTVLKAGHHGSKTSSGYPFMDLTKPEYSVISVGKYNKFKHPNQETLDKYAFYKMKVFRTDQDGTVDSFTDGKTVRFVSNQSPLELSEKPKVISLTANSATLQWTTNKPSNSEVAFGVQALGAKRVIDQAVTIHTVTLLGLKPETAYVFQVSSKDARQPDQIVTADGTFKTPAGDGVPMPKISAMSTSSKKIYTRRPFQVHVSIANPSKLKMTGLTFELYHTAMSPDMLLGKKENFSLPMNKSVVVNLPVEITWIGDLDLLGVLKKDGKIIDTANLPIEVLPKMVYVDCAHGNIEFYKGKFAGMKMDLGKNFGFDFRSISKSIDIELIRDAFIVIIPHPEADFAANELTALKEFVSKGGALILFCRADFANKSQPQKLNTVLSAVGSGLRFNDDEFCDPTNSIGTPWGVLMHVFPSTIIEGVTKILVRNACSLLNRKLEGLKASKDIFLLATGDEDSYDLDADGLNDGWLYASHSVRLPIPIVACEDTGMGRIACYGEPLYDDRLYAPSAEIQTPQFNRSIAKWLAVSRDKSLKDLLCAAENLDQMEDRELAAIRYEQIKGTLTEMVQGYVSQNQSDDARSAFSEFTSPTVTKLHDSVKEILTFKNLHGEGNPMVQDGAEGF